MTSRESVAERGTYYCSIYVIISFTGLFYIYKLDDREFPLFVARSSVIVFWEELKVCLSTPVGSLLDVTTTCLLLGTHLEISLTKYFIKVLIQLRYLFSLYHKLYSMICRMCCG